MSSNHALNQILSRLRAEDLFPPLAEDPQRKIFLLEGASKDSNFLGACFVGQPLYGADDTTVERLKSVFSAAFPAETILQITLLSTPDIDPTVSRYVEKRKEIPFLDTLSPVQRNITGHLTTCRHRFISAGKENPIIETTKVLTNVMTMILSIKIPCPLIPSERDLDAMTELCNKLREGLVSIGFSLEQIDAPQYLGLLRRILHMYDPYDTEHDADVLLRNQILSPGDRIQCDSNGIHINDTNIKVLSVKHYPKRASLAIMSRLIGDPGGVNNQLTKPWMLTLTVYYPQQNKKAAIIRGKAQSINYQAYGPLLRFIPKLAYKKQGFDILLHAMEEGEMLVEMSLTMTLFSKETEDLTKLSSLIRTYYAIYLLEMAEEEYIVWPVFWNTLPLFPTHDSIANTKRFLTMAVRHAVQFMPVLGEWRVTGNGAASIFVTRRGQPMLFDFYDSTTSYNGVVFAESGAGKSFLTQQLIVDYLSMGAKIWVIDVGRSYEKLAKVLGGEFIEFSENSRACMNPFTLVQDVDDEADLLKSLVSKMAAPTSGLDDYHMARLEEALRAVWGRLGNEMSITDVWDYFLQQEDPRLRDMGAMLYPWTRHGSYGLWFDGRNNLAFGNNLVVLELEELKAKKNLQQIILLQLIAKIQHEMYLSGTGQKKILIIDEAWDLLDDPGVAKFMEHGYRRFRKTNGAALIVTQSINDLYSSPNGTAIAENSPFLLIMQQKTESIDAVQKAGRVAIEPYGFQVMKTVHTVPGKYSEVLIYTRMGWGVARLVVDRFSQVMFSTKGLERTQVLSQINQGVPAIEAINRYIEQYG